MAFEHGDRHFAPRSKPDVIWSLINFLHKIRKSVYFVIVLLMIFQLKKKKIQVKSDQWGKPSGELETKFHFRIFGMND